ncbi:hypothetical protein ABMA27_009040 [Loxostege sticticalis]|uniref:Insertion element IS150 protein InsJ-like helix-turn-helix domain-containing protein n=1 Tax=Loxostege sticticalis TaxID=481309 RepID=A0ABR3H9Q6_LOXSC
MPAPLRREQREQIIALKRSGYKVTEIERWTGVSRKCIYFWLRRWEESGDISAHHRAVYQRATTAEQDAAIVAAHEANPFKPTRETSSEYSKTYKKILTILLSSIEPKRAFSASSYLCNKLSKVISKVYFRMRRLMQKYESYKH